MSFLDDFGKKYVEFHLEDYETCFECDISSVVTARNKIAEYESKIAEIKATKEQGNVLQHRREGHGIPLDVQMKDP